MKMLIALVILVGIALPAEAGTVVARSRTYATKNRVHTHAHQKVVQVPVIRSILRIGTCQCGPGCLCGPSCACGQ